MSQSNSPPVQPSKSERPYDGSDPEQVKDRQKDAKTREALRIQGLRYIMSSREGRAWIWGLLVICHPFQSSFRGNSNTFFLEGEANIGLQVFAELRKHCMEQYSLMEKENG